MARRPTWHPLAVAGLSLALGLALLALLLGWLAWRLPGQPEVALALLEGGVALVAGAGVMAGGVQALRQRRQGRATVEAERSALWQAPGLLLWRLGPEGELRDASASARDWLAAQVGRTDAAPLDALALDDAAAELALRRALLAQQAWRGEAARRGGSGRAEHFGLELVPASRGESWLLLSRLAGPREPATAGAAGGLAQRSVRTPAPQPLPTELLQRASGLGLDLPRALRRFDGATQGLQRLLEAFVPLAAALPARLHRALDGQLADPAAARRELLDLQALAGTLAFDRLALQARSALGALERPGGWPAPAQARFENQLREDLDGLRALSRALRDLTAPPGAGGAPRPTDLPGSLDPLGDLMARVRAEDGSAADWLAAQREALQPWLGEALAPLDEALRARDFAAARQLLSERYAMN